MTADFYIQTTTWQQDKTALKAIRRAVFIIEQKVPANLEWDDEDIDAIHLLAILHKCEPVGTGRLLKTGQIGRIAVLKQHRQCGIGTALLSKAMEAAYENGFSSVFLHAQTRIIPFYKNFGFKVSGQAFYEAGIEHYLMRKTLLDTQ